MNLVASGAARDGAARPSRSEIERMCVVHVVGPAGCSLEELAERLGLSRALGPVLNEAIRPLLTGGHLAMRDDLVSATEAGLLWLETKLLAYVSSAEGSR